MLKPDTGASIYPTDCCWLTWTMSSWSWKEKDERVLEHKNEGNGFLLQEVMTELFLLKCWEKICNRNFMEQGCRICFWFQLIRREKHSIHKRDLSLSLPDRNFLRGFYDIYTIILLPGNILVFKTFWCLPYAFGWKPASEPGISFG